MSFCSPGFELALSEFDALGVPPRVIVEVGTYDGDEALSLKKRYPDARVITFECDTVNYAYSRTFLEGTGVELVQAAVTDHENGVDFWPNIPSDPNRASGSILPSTEKLRAERLGQHGTTAGFTDSPTHVPSVRLDEFCRRAGITIDIIQIDVQGAEVFVLRGLGSLRPRIIFLEVNETADFGHYSGGASMKDLKQVLQDMGYECRWDNSADAYYFRTI
jgi:FkbM family methyltransferase